MTRSTPARPLAALALAAMALATPGRAATAYADVPAQHWARPAIEAITRAGIMQGHDGRFHGDKLVNRYQVATLMHRVLEEGDRRAARAAGPPAALHEATVRVAEQLASLRVRIETLQDGVLDLRGEVDGLRRDPPVSPGFPRHGRRPQLARLHRLAGR